MRRGESAARAFAVAALLLLSCVASLAQKRSAEEWSDEGARLARAGEIDRAIQAYNQALQLNPNLTPVYLNLGIAYFRGGRYGDAEKPLRKFLASQSTNAQARHVLGLCLLEQGKFSEAARELEAVRQGGADASVLLPLATAYFRDGRQEPARQAIETLLQERADSAEVHLVLGIGYAQDNENSKAVEEFEAARRQNPKLPWVHKWLAEALVKLNREEEALPLYQEELRLNPHDAEANYELGAILERRSQDEEAEKLLVSAIRSRPDYGSACYTLGKLYQRQNRLKEAQPRLEKAARLLPNDSSAHYQLGRLYQRLGRSEEAREEFRITERLQQERREKARQAILPP